MISVCEPLITARDRELVNDALATGWISSAGKYLDQFEQCWADYCGMQYGIAVSNGSTALDIAVDLLKLEEGDEVILPAFTIISPAQSIVRAGGIPVLVDTDPVTWQMNADRIEERITPRTRAILVVHIYGHPADMDTIMTVAEKHNLLVIEDAAEVHGAEYKGRRCGGIGHISTFSFYANKLITTGEGGMVLTKTAAHAEHARSLRNLCFRPERRFIHTELGYNYRLTNVQAAMGVGQMERLSGTIVRKRELARAYDAAFADVECVQLPAEMPWAKNVYWVYGIVLGKERDTDAVQVMSALRTCGVETRPFFWGIHQQPVFNDMGLFNGETYPIAEHLAHRGFYIPTGLGLSPQQQETVIAAVREVLQ
jgi:perosamine synthetase